MNPKNKKVEENNQPKGIIIKGIFVYGYEPDLGRSVLVGTLNHDDKIFIHHFPYFPPHKFGVEFANYSKKIKYKCVCS